MKKLLYFLKIVLCQDILFTIAFFITSYLNKEDMAFTIKDLFLAFIYSLGISGLLFFANAAWVILLETKLQIYLMVTISIILYVFVFFEFVLDISGAFRELLLPTVFGVYGGITLVLYEEKIKKYFRK